MGALYTLDACAPADTKPATRLSEIAVLLIKDLTADENGDLHARNVVSAMAEAYPRRLYQVLVAVNTMAHDHFERGFVELAREERHSIISDIYAENGAMKQFCVAMIKVHYNYPYRWRIIGFMPVEHKDRGIEDPDFDFYDSHPSLMED